MFSATMPPKIRQFAAKLLHEPKEISIAVSKPAERVTQGVFRVYDKDKNAVAVWLLKQKNLPSVIVFTGTKAKARQLERDLQKAKVDAKSISSDLEQKEREEVLRAFRSRRLPVLVATDVLSRGIDIEDIGMVINYDVPGDAEDYIHRIGRTARAESKGEAYTFVSPEENGKFKRIEQLMEMQVNVMDNPSGISQAQASSKSEANGKPKKKFFHKKGIKRQ